MNTFSIKGNIVSITERRIFPGEVCVVDGLITEIKNCSTGDGLPYILPGFIDSHVHVESSMLIPSEFARLAVVHGTVATISDPHEIANVCGLDGVNYMIENGKQVPFKFNFGAPSCVPATNFETAGAYLDAEAVTDLLQRQEIKYLSEMMNFPGVLHKDPEVMKKIEASHAAGKPVDGHAPGLRGEQARQYIDAGISTDHECFTQDEALDKLKHGMKILIREGSAAKNFDALIDLLHHYPAQIMFCSDDKHPDSLVEGHINVLCARAVAKGIDLFNVLQAACINPIDHYKLDVGMLKPGHAADFIITSDLVNFNIEATYINGQCVASKGVSHIKSIEANAINNFTCTYKKEEDFIFLAKEKLNFEVIEALDGQLITNKLLMKLPVQQGIVQPCIEDDVLKIAVVNRYHNAPVAISWVKNFGLKKGAIASSVAHDSHNIIVVGVDDSSITKAVNAIIDMQGGVAVVHNTMCEQLALPVAGLMSQYDGYAVAQQYTALDKMAKELGATLSAPFMTLSFMALLVIPHLKLSDKGLFDGDAFQFIDS